MNLNDKGILDVVDISEVGITEGLIGYWPLDGHTYDVSGNLNHGANNGAIVVSGLNGLCYKFVSGSSITANNVLIDIYDSKIFSWGAWINKTSGNRVLMSIPNNVLELNAGSVASLTVKTNLGYENCYGTTTLVAGNWYHIFCTYDKGEAKIYVNGSLERVVNMGLFADPGGNIIIGNWSSLTQSFIGRIDDIRIYNRALLEQEIKLMYELDSGKSAMKQVGEKIYIRGQVKEV